MARIIGRTSPGFTLIEFVIVIVIIGILAVVAIPRVTVFNTVKLNSAVKKIVSDIRYMQQLALATHDAYRMSFNVAQDTYEIRRVSDGAYAKDPFTRGNFAVNVRTDPVIGGADITSASFRGTPGFQYDWQGNVQNATGANLTAEGSVTIANKGESTTIYVRPLTGTVRVQ